MEQLEEQLGIRLSQALSEGNIEASMQAIKNIIEENAEVSLTLANKEPNRLENPFSSKPRIKQALIQLGLDENSAEYYSARHNTLDEALQVLFS